MTRIPTHRPPTHPGEMLLEEFLLPMGITQRELADAIHVPYQRINEIVHWTTHPRSHAQGWTANARSHRKDTKREAKAVVSLWPYQTVGAGCVSVDHFCL